MNTMAHSFSELAREQASKAEYAFSPNLHEYKVIPLTAMTTAEQDDYKKRTPSFLPVDDTIAFVNQVDWQDVRQRCRAGVNNVGLVLAVIGTKTHEFGRWLAEL